MQEKLLNSHSELKSDIHALDFKMNEIQTAIASNENRILKAEQRIEKNEKKLDTVDQTLSAQNKETEDALIQLEMDKASFYLRFQNILEDKDEDLGDKMAELIAETLQQDKQEIIREIDEVYRVQTNYQRSIVSMLGTEKEKTTSTFNIQNIQSVLAMIQEGMNKTQESIANNHEETRRNHEYLKTDVGEIKDNIKKMDKIEKVQQNIVKNEQRIQKVEVKMEQTDRKMEMMEQNQTSINREMEESITYLEMEKASFYLRFQNIVEQKDEDLGELMAGILAEVTQRDKEDIQRDMDKIYRVHTNYACRHKLTKEVHIRFTKKSNGRNHTYDPWVGQEYFLPSVVDLSVS
ncbi:tropomyosin-like [Pituophis catenifer annectens]|uniref:tropomyosin-like n=1 Tax=Pituophis catenifer annectens TaxID=94852 RepID=UPI003991FD94